MMICFKCGMENPAHAKFCSKCGSNLIPLVVQKNTRHPKYWKLIAGVVFVAVLAFGGFLLLHKEADDLNTVGNTNGNIINGAFVAQEGDWIYYLKENMVKNPEGNYGTDLWKSKLDGSKASPLIKSSSLSIEEIFVVDEWIYFTQGFDGIWRIRTDGTDRQQLCGKRSVIFGIIKDEIYFSQDAGVHEAEDFESADNYQRTVRKMNLDGSKQKVLYRNNYCNSFVIGNDNIYYIQYKDGQSLDSSICVMDLNGEERKSLLELEASDEYDCFGVICPVNKSIFYSHMSGDKSGIKWLEEGKTDVHKSKIKSENNFLAEDGFIYNILLEDSLQLPKGKGIYQWEMDGSYKKIAESVIIDDGCEKEILFNNPINKIGSWLFYNRTFHVTDNDSEGNYYSELWKVKTDGTEEQKVF